MSKPVATLYTFPDGSSVELYTIGYLAELLGRTATSIRRWEVGGLLPKTGFKDSRGFRLYSQSQMDAIVKSAEETGVMQGRSMAQTNFEKVVKQRLNVIWTDYKARMGEQNEEDRESSKEQSNT